jgi:undecaprenyl-diphosphatase
MHTPWMDRFMFHATDITSWIPVYLLFVFFIVKKYRWQTLLIFVFVAIMILVSDQVSNGFKEMTCRLRPSNEPGVPVHIVYAYKGGLYGFYSAHASNNFAIAFFLIILLRKHYPLIYIPVLLWALFLSYTRIYLGVHYPGDIIAGMIMGSMIGFLFGKSFLLANERIQVEKKHLILWKKKEKRL